MFLHPALLRSAVPEDSTAYRLVALGKALLAENKLQEAEQSFRGALKKDAKLTAAMAGLGQVYLAKEDWGEANDWYEKVLKHEPENLDAMYHRGICFRETGKFKALLLRKLDWDNSAKYFERVLAKDSLFDDTLYQYAQLFRYREDYTAAIMMGHHQVRLKPELVEPQRGLFRLYQYFLDNRKTDEVMRWLQQNGSEHARYFIGEAYRRAGKLAAADSVLRTWLVARPRISAVPAYLSLVRLRYQQNNPGAAEKFYWQAVDAIATQVDAALLFDDAKYVVTDAEMQIYRRRSTPQDYRAFFHQFWISRDPTPAAETNARLAEHYRRLLYAEENYLFDRFRTWFNNPDQLNYLKFPPGFYLNDRFNDKGLIYIRHGEPDERIVTVKPEVPTNESWRYGQTETTPEMIFHFVVGSGAAANNWRVAPFLDHPEFLEDRLTWGTVYYRMLSDPSQALRYEDELASQSRGAVDAGFRSDRHTWDKSVKPVEVAWYTAFFKAPEGKSYFDLYYGFQMPEDDKRAAMLDTSAVYEHGLALHDLRWNPIERQRHQITKAGLPANGQAPYYIGQYHVAVKPDSYHVAFFVKDLATPRIGGWKKDMRVPKFWENELAVSSIVLASSMAPATGNEPFVKNGLHIVPNPAKRFDRSQPVYVYFEVYHLTPDSEGKSSFVVEYTTLLRQETQSGAKKLFAIFGSGVKPATTVITAREADRTTSAEYLALDLSSAGRGEFRLAIKVRDKNSG
ncbi:MAG: GWxTD domain-containing protein, partial [candidate division KSB1 bacterium]|nr:GWxTD domain-containing protein [candidate division KSB1 bacterium]